MNFKEEIISDNNHINNIQTTGKYIQNEFKLFLNDLQEEFNFQNEWIDSTYNEAKKRILRFLI